MHNSQLMHFLNNHKRKTREHLYVYVYKLYGVFGKLSEE